MELTTPITAGNPLLVAALHSEAVYLCDSHPVLITGVGKVRAATALAKTLAESPHRPSLIVNVGTAGALASNLSGVYEIGQIRQHDFDNDSVSATTGISFGGPISIGPSPMVLATGDTFVADSAHRDQLAAAGAHLCDMEGYALAFVARTFGIPFRSIKVVSDSADEAAGRSWPETLDTCAKELASWVAQHLG